MTRSRPPWSSENSLDDERSTNDAANGASHVLKDVKDAKEGTIKFPQPVANVLEQLQPANPSNLKHFQYLARKWKAATEHMSSAARMAKHPAYREIVQMGSAVIPLLLAELRRNPDFWFAALREISGENPVPAQSAGQVKEMARAWIEWGRQRGYIP
jgi:hypothetical protein